MKNRTLYTAGLILSTLGINAQQKVGITYQVEYRDGITNERIYRTPHSVITELIDGVATATVTEIANLPKGYKLAEGQGATITQTVTKGQTNILTFRVKATDLSTKLEEGAEFRRVANGTRGFSWSAGTNPSFEYVIPENLGGFEHVRRNIDFHVSIANNPFLQGGNNNNWNYHILDFERIQEADLRDYIADSYIQTRHPFIYLTTTGTTPQWGSSDNPAASRVLGNSWSNNTRDLHLGFDLAIHHLVPTGTYSFPIRLWYPLQQGQTYWTTSLKDQLVFEIKVINNYLKFNMEQTRLTTAPSNKSQADDLAQSHTVSGTTNLESGAQIRFKNQNGTILGNTTVGTNGRWSATITGLKVGDTLTAEIGRAGYYFLSDTLLVEDGSAPHVPNATVSLYRGESYPGKVLTAQDNLSIAGLTTNPTSPGAGGTFSISGGDLSLTGTAALEPSRTNPNTTTTSTYTVTARDGGNRTGTGTLTIQLKPQTDAYTAVARTGLTFDSNNATPQAASLLTVNRSADSRLSTTPSGARYEFVGAGVNMNQIGEQTVKVRAIYADGSTDEVDVTVTVRDTTAPTGTGVTWTRYRGEAYGSTPFFTAEDNVNVAYMSYGQGTSPVSTDNSFPTSTYRRGNSSTSKRLVIIVTGNVPLDATTGTTRYIARFADVNPASLGNESADIVSTLTIKEQTEAYTATAKTNVSVAKGTRITEADLINIVKFATDSTLPTPAADGRITVLGKTTTYSVTSGSLDTTSPGTKNVTILITYPDGSTSTVSTSFTVTNQAPIVATPNNIIIWKDQAIQNKITVTANDPDGNLTNALFKTNTVANAPANLNGIGVSTTGTNVIIEGTPIIGAGKYTRRLEVIDNNNTPVLSNPFEIYILSAENRTLTLTSRATATEEQVKTEALRGITGNSGNDTITATVVGTIPSARDTNRTVQVDLKTSTNETKRITVTLEYPANQVPTVDNVPDIAVWAGQKIQNPVSVAVNEPDGTIVSVRPRLNTFPMPDGTDARVENGSLIIDGTPASTLKAEDNLRRLILRDNDGAEVMTNQFNITVMKANDQTINRTTRTAPSQTDIIDIVRTSIEGTDTAKAAVNIAVGSIPTPVQADAGNKTVQVRLTTSSGENKTISITINYPPAVCTKPAVITGTALQTIVGISDIRTNTDEWPHSRKGGWIALESNNKGFVINRLSTEQITNLTHPQEGMIAYDTTEKCLKIFNGTEWKCFSNPVCPQFK